MSKMIMVLSFELRAEKSFAGQIAKTFPQNIGNIGNFNWLEIKETLPHQIPYDFKSTQVYVCINY